MVCKVEVVDLVSPLVEKAESGDYRMIVNLPRRVTPWVK
jgi:hypothetical protein